MGKNGIPSVLVLFFIVMMLLYSFHLPTALSCIEQERESLLGLKASFIVSSNRLTSWKGTDCCSWEGVGCDRTNGGHVVKLDLRNYEYSYSSALFSNGEDSNSLLLDLKYLNYLDLSANFFNFTQIPHYVTQLCELRYLNLSSTYFHGEISPSFGNLIKLEHLDLSANMFNGPIPSILHNMTSLKFLSLSDNRYHSSIPSRLSNLKNLHTLILGSNLFNSIEGGLFSFIRNNCHLKSLDLSFNHFLGEDVFGISYQNFSSTTCKEYGLERLNLESIKFGMYSIIPSWLGELKNLRSLHLRNNSLYGQIPSSFGNLSSLESLDISYNMLNGGIPISFERLSNLISLNLRWNNLDGVIPESFGQLRSLNTLDLSRNDLKGVLSEIHFVNLSRLEALNMNGNELLSFEMKHSWVPPFRLKGFAVSSTLGFGTTELPRWIGTQKEMLALNLFNTNIVGPIPTWLRFQNLHFLDLSYNQINGSLPNSIDDQMPNLIGLFISDAHIKGPLPQSLCRLKNLTFLVFSNNNLAETIPSCLSALNLELLDLSSNKLLGVLPSSFQNLSNLQVMNLARNQLEGDPLMAMRSFKSLSVLDLEGNKFSGNIPEWVGKSLQSLQIMNLRANMFNATIPSTLWLLPRLQILILADNKLVGNIPPNVGNFSASRGPITDNELVCNPEEDPFKLCYMSYITQVMKSGNLDYSYLQLYSTLNIDLSNNNLHGHIPKEIVLIKGLFSLNLSHNNLSGTIPVEVGRSVALESLDLSFNQLSGSIPNGMSSLNSLGTLKLSNNNFSGRIPREGHLSTFNDASSYENNPNLCGDPLSVICPNENPSEPSIKIEICNDNCDHEEDKLEKMWFYIIVMLGYALGFWGVVGSLILKGSWRHAYFQFMDETKDKIYATILKNMTRLKQQIVGNNIHQ